MEDIMSMVGQIMSDPEQMKQLSSLAASLGLSGNDAQPQPEPSPPPQNPPKLDLSSILPMQDSTLSALFPLMQKLQASTDDKYIAFLRALQPLLSEQRRPKVDHAILFLKLLTLVPYLEESGILPKNNALDSILRTLKGVLL